MPRVVEPEVKKPRISVTGRRTAAAMAAGDAHAMETPILEIQELGIVARNLRQQNRRAGASPAKTER